MRPTIQNFIKGLPAGRYLAKNIHEAYDEKYEMVSELNNITVVLNKLHKDGLLCKEQSNEKIPGKRGAKPCIYIKQ